MEFPALDRRINTCIDICIIRETRGSHRKTILTGTDVVLRTEGLLDAHMAAALVHGSLAHFPVRLADLNVFDDDDTAST